MSMFPGPGAQMYYNEAGEPLGWDYPSFDEGDTDPFDDYDNYFEPDDIEPDDDDDDEEEELT